MIKVNRRMEDNHDLPAVLVLLQRYAQFIIIMATIMSGAYYTVTNFATAADLRELKTTFRVELKVVALEARRDRIQDELYKMRSEGGDDKATKAQIERYEGELRDIRQRLRDLETKR